MPKTPFDAVEGDGYRSVGCGDFWMARRHLESLEYMCDEVVEYSDDSFQKRADELRLWIDEREQEAVKDTP